MKIKLVFVVVPLDNSNKGNRDNHNQYLIVFCLILQRMCFYLHLLAGFNSDNIV